jgi:hypothetical protein
MISPIENVSSIAVVVYGTTLYWMIRKVRKNELDFVKAALTNPLWPRTDLKFFVVVYKKYYELTKSKTLIAVNLLSLLVVLFGLLFIILDI